MSFPLLKIRFIMGFEGLNDYPTGLCLRGTILKTKATEGACL